MRAYWGSGGIAPRTSALDGGGWSASPPGIGGWVDKVLYFFQFFRFSCNILQTLSEEQKLKLQCSKHL
jgi:hypothetical protein